MQTYKNIFCSRSRFEVEKLQTFILYHVSRYHLKLHSHVVSLIIIDMILKIGQDEQLRYSHLYRLRRSTSSYLIDSKDQLVLI